MFIKSIPQHVHCFLQQRYDMFFALILSSNSSTFSLFFLYIFPHVRLSTTEVCNVSNSGVWRRIVNTPHLVCRQSSQNLNPERRLDRLVTKELRGRLVFDNDNSNLSHNYEAFNVAFEDISPNTKVRLIPGLYAGFSNCDPANVLVKVGWPWMVNR